MADLDLSLSDALTDSVPQSSPGNMVQRDFVAALEAETFDDQVGETVGKKDYIPLLDKDDKKDGSAVTPGGQKTAQRPEPQGEVRPRLTEQQLCATDFLSGPGKMAGFEDQWSIQPVAPQTQDSGRMGPFQGFSQPGMVNVDFGVAPFQTERPSSIAEPQTPPLSLASDPLKQPLHSSAAGVLGDPWEVQGGLQTDLPFTPSVSTVISRHASQLAESPLDPQWPHPQSAGAGEERENEGADRKHQQQQQLKKKKKRRPREEVYDHMENRSPVDHHGLQVENTPPTDGPQRRSPWREGGWEREDGGRGGGRGKKGRGRKKVPEEWGVFQEPDLPPPGSRFHHDSAADLPEPPLTRPHTTESPSPSTKPPPVCLTEDSLPLGLEDSPIPRMPLSLTQDLLSLTSSFPTSTVSPEPLPASPTPISPSLGTGPSPKQTPPQSPGLENTFSKGETGTPVAPLITPTSSTLGKAEEGLSLLPSDLFMADTPPSTDNEAAPPSPKADQAEGTPSGKVKSAPESFFTISVKEDHVEETSVPSSPPPSKEAPLLTPTFPQPGKMAPSPFSSETPGNHDIDVSSKDSPLAPTEGELPPQETPSTPSDHKEPFHLTDSITPEQPLPEDLSKDVSVLLPTPSPGEPEEAQKQTQPKQPDSASAKGPASADGKQPPSQTSPVLSPSSPTPLVLSPSSPTPPTPPALSSLSPSAAPFPAPNSDLNPTALPFFPISEFADVPPKEGRPADPSTAEVKAEMADKPDKVEKTDSSQKVDKFDMFNKEVKMEVKSDMVEKKDKVESAVKHEKEKVEKIDVLEKTDKAEKVDKVEKVDEKEKSEKVEKTETEKTAEKVEKMEKDEKLDKDKEAKKTEEKTEKAEKKESEVGKTSEKTDGAEKTDTAAKGDKPEKTGKAADTNGVSAAPGKDLTSPDKKTKPAAAAASTKSSAAKPRPSSLSTGAAAPPKRPSPTTNSSSTAPGKKSPMPKAPTPTTGTKRLPSAASRPPTTTATPREVKPKTTATERRTPVPKANATGPGALATSKNGSSTTDVTKPRVPLSTRTSASAATARRPTAAKTESKPGEVKKSSTLKTTPADSGRPKTTPNRGPITLSSTLVASTAATRARAAAAAAKPATPAPAPEKKPPVPRAPRSSAATPRPAPRPSTAPAPDIRNIRSKIGSTDNMKYQPGGGKVSAAQSRTDALAQGSLSKETSQGKVQILSKKVDLSKVTSKCGSKSNLKHKPGGGEVKIESHKVNFKDKAQSKVGSMDNVSHEPGGGHIKAEGEQETAGGIVAPSSGSPATVPAGSAAQENGVKEGAPCGGGEGLRDPLGLDSRIPETN